MLGFMAGMGESENDGNIPYRLNSDGVINLGIQFIPDHHAFHALGDRSMTARTTMTSSTACC